MRKIPNNFGFPRMHKEKNEKRDFTPGFFGRLRDLPLKFFLETGYGRGMGFTHGDYSRENPNITFTDNESCYRKEVVVVLRAPEFERIRLMRKGSLLISMLHYPTRPIRNSLIQKQDIRAVSLDSITDDFHQRLIVNLKATAWNGVDIGFKALNQVFQRQKGKKVLKALVLGAGPVGREACAAACYYGNRENRSLFPNITGVLPQIINSDLTRNEKILDYLLPEVDVLVDATTRRNTSEFVIRNLKLELLPRHAVIIDLTADPYLPDCKPPKVKAIEGIPHGTLDKMLFHTTDRSYTRSIPEEVDTSVRRTVVSCQAWPGIFPEECMLVYGIQLDPFIRAIAEKPIAEMNLESQSPVDRALYRGTYRYYMRSKKEKIIADLPPERTLIKKKDF